MTANNSHALTGDQLALENEELRNRLAEAEDTLRAIHAGEVDAILVSTEQGEQIYTLKGAEEPYRVLFEQMNEGAVTISENGHILYSNQSFAAMIGVSLDRVIGTSFEKYLDPSQVGPFRNILARSVQGPVRAQIPMSSVDGTSIPVQLSITFLPSAKVPTYCIVLTDLTERVLAERTVAAERQRLFDVLEGLPAMILSHHRRPSHNLCQPRLPGEVRGAPGTLPRMGLRFERALLVLRGVRSAQHRRTPSLGVPWSGRYGCRCLQHAVHRIGWLADDPRNGYRHLG